MVYIIGSGPIDVKEGIFAEMEKDKLIFMRNGDKSALEKVRLLIGEVQRSANKDTSDTAVMTTLKQIRKQTMKHPEPDMLLISLIDTYIPPPVSDEELIEQVKLSGYSDDVIAGMGKKAYSIIGMAKKHFGDREINSQALKEYIAEIIGD